MSTLDKYKAKLAIDPDSLSECLVEQPDLYYHVSMETAVAVSERDAAKLALDVVEAEIDQHLRRKAADDGEKVTESLIQKRLELASEVIDANNNLLDNRLTADKWLALKESFQQRSFMLRELVALRIAERGDHAAASGSVSRPSSAAMDMAEQTKRDGSESRKGYRARRRLA